MKILIVLSALVIGALANPESRAFVSTPQRVKSHGYPVQEHTAQTNDGYILTMFRIPYSHRLGNQNDNNKPVVFLMHGILSSSDCWLLNGPDNAIGFMLADAGYDVWMGNARGNVYSKKHATKSPLLPPFWDFEWHEIAMFDLPTMIDYVLYVTGQDQVHYIGHSQGTTAFMVLTSNLPRYNDKIKTSHMLAPVGYAQYMQSPLVTIAAPLLGHPNLLVDLMGNSEFMPSNKLIHMLGPALCEEKSLFLPMCTNILFLIAGWDSQHLNVTLMPDALETHPAGSSTNQIIHYLQEFNSGYFREYDYGTLLNQKKYNSKYPREYRAENIGPVSPVNFYYSDNDYFAAVKDVHRIARIMGDNVKLYRVKYRDYNHLDFLFAINVKEVINDCILDKINEFEGKSFTGKKCTMFRRPKKFRKDLE